MGVTGFFDSFCLGELHCCWSIDKDRWKFMWSSFGWVEFLHGRWGFKQSMFEHERQDLQGRFRRGTKSDSHEQRCFIWPRT
ncbi:toll/interleukin-1 receptor domain-containing adapter protein isoform X5 [Ambystoma mexicanum]|uniref:toll/interleukin-1 receptor domain-containing adapter protein isoform X5 n=1 Tax=Ambystoma mexicanum TaxID=8296 RepID=UPI0037E8CA2B